MVSIVAFQAIDPGSIPGQRIFYLFLNMFLFFFSFHFFKHWLRDKRAAFQKRSEATCLMTIYASFVSVFYPILYFKVGNFNRHRRKYTMTFYKFINSLNTIISIHKAWILLFWALNSFPRRPSWNHSYHIELNSKCL